MRIRPPALLALPVFLAGCGAPGPESEPRDGPGAPTPGVAATPAPGSDRPELLRPAESEGSPPEPAGADGEAIRVVFLGTSLTEGLGLEHPGVEAWPARIGELADSAGLTVETVNAGLGGETSAGLLRRLDWVMQGSPDIVVIETGANDGLRGLPVAQLEENLGEILGRLRTGHPEVRVAVVQMEAPPNMGADYTDAFRMVYHRVAAEHGFLLLPFLLESVAGQAELNQADGIHPTAEGHWIMARDVWPTLEELLRQPGAG